MTKWELQAKAYEALQELDTIAHSDSRMGIYDIEHLEKARELLREISRGYK